MTVYGIDLGTTNSLIAAFTGGEPKLIANGLGSVLTPSVVNLDTNGTVLVGEPALNRLVSEPERSVASFKRFMGTSRITRLGSRSFQPEELSALVLKSLKADAEAFAGEEVRDVVISVPAYFNEPQRRATQNAGR
ncbi:MAG: Hsp70 family protein, partial [Methylobacteriaceae bacterium]|nr:Hsp70 family protein [Methylobacteriaceae bacterium]